VLPARRAQGGWRVRLTPIAMLLPAVAVLVAITVFPLLYELRLTVVSWELTTGFPPQFVGLQNFERVFFQDPRFWNAVANTGLLVGVGVSLQTVFGTTLALELHRLGWARTTAMSLMLIPVMIAPVIAGFQFRMIYNDQFGWTSSRTGRFAAPRGWPIHGSHCGRSWPRTSGSGRRS